MYSIPLQPCTDIFKSRYFIFKSAFASALEIFLGSLPFQSCLSSQWGSTLKGKKFVNVSVVQIRRGNRDNLGIIFLIAT